MKLLQFASTPDQQSASSIPIKGIMYEPNSIGSQENMTPTSAASFALMSGPQKVSRKQKSLGLLCEKFISRFPEAVPDGEKCEIPLDDLAKQMCTERRRIYDIVNVLEAVQMMTKVRVVGNTIFIKNYDKYSKIT